MCAWFGDQVSFADLEYTFEASSFMPVPTKGVALIVEIKGLVLP